MHRINRYFERNMHRIDRCLERILLVNDLFLQLSMQHFGGIFYYTIQSNF